MYDSKNAEKTYKNGGKFKFQNSITFPAELLS